MTPLVQKGQLWFDPKKHATVEVRYADDAGILCVVCRPNHEPELVTVPESRFARMELRSTE